MSRRRLLAVAVVALCLVAALTGWAVMRATAGNLGCLSPGTPLREMADPEYRTTIGSVLGSSVESGTAYAATDGARLYVGSGEPFRWRRVPGFAPPLLDVALGRHHEVLYGHATGLYRSRDGGRTWTRASCDLIVNDVAVQRSNPSFIYLAADSGIAPSKYTLGGIYRTTDGGRKWARSDQWPTENADVGPSVQAVAVDPRNPRDVAAAPYAGGILRSLDGGDDWTYIPLWGSGDTDNGRETWNLAYGAGPAFALWAGTAGGVFRLSASGQWSRAGLHGKSVRVAPDPRNPQAAFALLGQNGSGAPGVRRTANGGRTWLTVRGLPANISGMSIRPTDDTIYAWASHRIYRSTDHGETWRALPPLPIT